MYLFFLFAYLFDGIFLKKIKKNLQSEQEKKTDGLPTIGDEIYLNWIKHYNGS